MLKPRVLVPEQVLTFVLGLKIATIIVYPLGDVSSCPGASCSGELYIWRIRLKNLTDMLN